MRYGLLALSIAMLTSGAVAAQSVLDISRSAAVPTPAASRMADGRSGGSYGSLPFTLARAQAHRIAAR